jgi:hypothetical protein
MPSKRARALAGCGTWEGLLLVLLVTLVVVEVIVLVGVAVALFLLGAPHDPVRGGDAAPGGTSGVGAMIAVRPRRRAHS